MLPAYIIHEILEQERKRQERIREEIFIELPDGNTGDGPAPYQQDGDEPAPPNRGVVIIDFFV